MEEALYRLASHSIAALLENTQKMARPVYVNHLTRLKIATSILTYPILTNDER